jgi:hypothetical protein
MANLAFHECGRRRLSQQILSLVCLFHYYLYRPRLRLASFAFETNDSKGIETEMQHSLMSNSRCSLPKTSPLYLASCHERTP